MALILLVLPLGFCFFVRLFLDPMGSNRFVLIREIPNKQFSVFALKYYNDK